MDLRIVDKNGFLTVATIDKVLHHLVIEMVCDYDLTWNEAIGTLTRMVVDAANEARGLVSGGGRELD